MIEFRAPKYRKIYQLGRTLVLAIPVEYQRKFKLTAGTTIVWEANNEKMTIWRADLYAIQKSKDYTGRDKQDRRT